jgi:hypothetical protein
MPMKHYHSDPIDERCRRLTDKLTELTGITWTFGYIGNTYGMPDTRAWRDDRSWSAFAAHPGRVGGYGDRIGGHSTDELPQLHAQLQGACALAMLLNDRGMSLSDPDGHFAGMNVRHA